MLSVDMWLGYVILGFMVLQLIPDRVWNRLFGLGALEPSERRWIGVEQDYDWGYDVPVRVKTAKVKRQEWTGTGRENSPVDEIPF